MLLSFLKYALVIVTVFLCLTTLGAPTTSILGAAGVLTIMISMGAQSLVADILSGFFIIFEGTYKVGDMITVDDWHGQVMEIGIRNTKIRDLISSDVKIMNNSTIKNVINFSVYPSFAAIQIGIEYGVDLQKLEEIIEREKPVIKKNIPFMIGELMYLGVDDFADSAVILKFQVACRNQDYLKAKRALNREIKLMFDRNGINVPFPQIVLNTRTEEESINNSVSKLRYPDEKSGDKVD
jgi:small conductance mechanosensitive channel